MACGGMAQVWQGTDEVLRRKVAVKLLHPHLAADGSFVTRFRQEAVAAARLAHPGIVSIYDTCSEAGTEAIVMELVPGQTLRQRLDDPTPIDPWQAAGLAAQVAEALDAAHRAGLVHRDIKPANVLLAGDGRVKVADFGIAKAVEEADLTQPGLMVGTAKYVAPEQVEGKPVDARTDIYSLGIVLYEMLCGRAAVRGRGRGRHRARPPPARPAAAPPGPTRGAEGARGDRVPGHGPRTGGPLRLGRRPAAPRCSPRAPPRAPRPTSPAPTSPRRRRPRRAAARPGPRAAAARAGRHPVVPADRARAGSCPPSSSWSSRSRSGIAGLLLGRSGAGDLFGGVKDAITGTARALPHRRHRRGRLRPASATTRRRTTTARTTSRDGDPDTAWTTESYNNRDITVLKPGVGLVLTAEQAGELSRAGPVQPHERLVGGVLRGRRRSREPSTRGATRSPPSRASRPGTTTIDLEGTTGRSVLIWITDRGDGTARAARRDPGGHAPRRARIASRHRS